MPLRFRRNRVLIISCIAVFIIIYVINNRSENRREDEDNLPDTDIKKVEVKRSVDKIIRKIDPTTTTTSQIPTRSVREEIVEIDGKKVKKVDWHDYELIAQENSRTGNF